MAQPLDIQIERSLTNTPTTLLFGEPAWDDANEDMYLGNSSGTPILITKDFFVFPVSRNANISSNQALRRQNGSFSNVVPYTVPFDGEIYCITAERQNNNLTRTWDLVVEVNTVVVRTVSVTSGNQNIVDGGLNIAVNEGDNVAVFFRNASATINRPSGIVYGRRT